MTSVKVIQKTGGNCSPKKSLPNIPAKNGHNDPAKDKNVAENLFNNHKYKV